MTNEFLTDEERSLNRKRERARALKTILLGRGNDGPLSAISEILGNRFSNLTGVNERIVSVNNFVEALVQSGFAGSIDEAREKILPEMKEKEMLYEVKSDSSYSIRVSKVTNGGGEEAYRIIRYIG